MPDTSSDHSPNSDESSVAYERPAVVSEELSPEEQRIKDQLDLLKNALVNSRPPYFSGTLQLKQEDLILFLREERSLGRIDFSNVKEEELEHLSNTCETATFGKDQEDMLDESYRKAGKLDPVYFASKIDPQSSGLVEFIRYNLLSGDASRKRIKVELYKLNVYGEDSFFKFHKDTPRSTTMFGSLVIILPSPHVGGALILRHKDKEWTFDSAKEIAGSADPKTHIGFVTFFSDVDHEVTLVKSGYRVTLTYNLYHEDPDTKSLDLTKPLPMNEFAVKNALRTLLEDKEFFPDGAYLGFGLNHEYPIEMKPEKISTLKFIAQNLKGSDALLMKACKEFALDSRLYFSWEVESHELIAPDTKDVESSNVTVWNDDMDDIDNYLWLFHGAKVIGNLDGDDDEYEDGCEDGKRLRIRWVTETTGYNQLKFPGRAFGNDAQVFFTYGQFCLIVRVGPAGDRAIVDSE